MLWHTPLEHRLLPINGRIQPLAHYQTIHPLSTIIYHYFCYLYVAMNLLPIYQRKIPRKIHAFFTQRLKVRCISKRRSHTAFRVADQAARGAHHVDGLDGPWAKGEEICQKLMEGQYLILYSVMCICIPYIYNVYTCMYIIQCDLD